MPSNDQIKTVFKLSKKLRSAQGVELKMASRIYICKDLKINENFQAVSRDTFDSDVKNEDFSNNEKAAKEINIWVEDQTNHVIKNLISPNQITPLTSAVIVNAIYFKGEWMSPFSKALDGDFHVTQEKTIKVPIMRQENSYSYAESSELNSKLLRLPYVGNTTSMLVILPNEIDGLSALVEKLKDPEAISLATKAMKMEERVNLTLPKFRVDTSIDLKKVLQNIGVTKIFTSEGNLSHLFEGAGNVSVTSAIQKAYLDVNEKGTEAGAANALTMMTSSGVVDTSPVKQFIVDRPFYLQLEIWQNGINYAILNGVVNTI
ncbi:serpin (serine protease inhibitor) domain-containing protein [Phthorimaea operculella]|nr:serpin (serine protease inhibitor) domain-containing protein [Phthorimaea operculella]